jgi:hypothetical protein
MLLSGAASDAGGLGSVRVYVNGHKVADGTAGAWSASAPLAQIAQWANPATRR